MVTSHFTLFPKFLFELCYCSNNALVPFSRKKKETKRLLEYTIGKHIFIIFISRRLIVWYAILKIFLFLYCNFKFNLLSYLWCTIIEAYADFVLCFVLGQSGSRYQSRNDTFQSWHGRELRSCTKEAEERQKLISIITSPVFFL